MKLIRKLLIILFLQICFLSYSQHDSLQLKIKQIVQSKNAEVGFAMLGIEDNDSLSVNGNVHYPMQSVFKFHLALAILNVVDNGKLKLDQEIFIKKSDLLPNTWSPIRVKYPNGNVKLKLSEIITYTVSQSDNNGCDILFGLIGGPAKVNGFMHKSGIPDISVVATEAEMHKDWETQFRNWTTPEAVVQILKKFHNQKILSISSTSFLYKTMVETSTGPDRLKGKLPQGTQVAHKTGSSGSNEKGVTAAFNDIGIVTLPNGKHYAIAVFITNSKENDEANAAIIAEISKAVWDYYLTRS
jgi:beta-lactamase class A